MDEPAQQTPRAVNTMVPSDLLSPPFEQPGQYHYYDKLEDYRPQPFYSRVTDETDLLRQLQQEEENLHCYSFGHEWIPQYAPSPDQKNSSGVKQSLDVEIRDVSLLVRDPCGSGNDPKLPSQGVLYFLSLTP